MWETKNDDRRGGGVDSAECCDGQLDGRGGMEENPTHAPLDSWILGVFLIEVVVGVSDGAEAESFDYN